MASLANKIAIVTGASRGAGRAVACVLGEAGATVYVTGRTVRALAEDSDVLRRSGEVLTVGDLAREYGFTDVDGRQPAAFRMPEA